MESKKLPCCQTESKKDRGIISGVIYGLIPHAGCMAFILFAVAGITGANFFLGKYLFKTSVFYSLIVFSFIFATISAFIYVKRKQSTFKNEWKYLSVLYSTVIIVNLIMLFVVFPMTANLASAQPSINSDNLSNLGLQADLQEITLNVDIPCSGHASLIIYNLNNAGVNSKFIGNNNFKITYDPNLISKKEILSLNIFNEFKAKEVRR